ncbi:phage major capsid protein [Geodermatophilus obscurus]|uniref:Phage major capsid protein, HK97 n=1 Tax=Geodermatophilus obscurus (strain ATCC 25078 / DSM 43160 / JCM 3152 / CCUG 61914 / KCC A-0152 / KCTC 9177 / NBRC 13315 / NRRL B-3577 / G-20) TaxID=526225 RepID=D2SBR0_GEOOG|nr:phage major capsid protein [Geodermatophilus obscurus]ADB76167.1 phage major capsid protein, HK97 [Geodermatophilus obscurus DSM 43160]
MHVAITTPEHARQALDRADQLASAARKSGRPLTDAEHAEVRDLLAGVQQHRDETEMRDRIEGMRRPGAKAVYGSRSTGGTAGEAFTSSTAFQSLQMAFKSGALTGRWTSGPVEVPDYFTGRKATLLTGDFPFEPDVRPGIQPILQRPIVVTDLFAPGTTDSALVRYVEETLFTNGATTVGEGGLKPESALAFDSVDEPVRKIAHHLPVSDEMLEDSSQMRSYIDSRLRLGVQLVEETQLLSGDGTGTNLRGLLNRTGLQNLTLTAPTTGTNPSIAETLYQAITNVRVNALVEPDGVVMHPSDYAALRLAKDSGGEFNAGGPFGALAGTTVWGLPVALSMALPVNTAIVGAFRSQAQVFRRSGLVVEASNSHADYWTHNLTSIRAELRVALAVFRPSAFVRLAGLQHAGVSA